MGKQCLSIHVVTKNRKFSLYRCVGGTYEFVSVSQTLPLGSFLQAEKIMIKIIIYLSRKIRFDIKIYTIIILILVSINILQHSQHNVG